MHTLIVLLSFAALIGIIVVIEAAPLPAAIAIGTTVAMVLVVAERRMARRAR